VVNLSGSLNAKKRISEGTSLGSIRLWVAKRRHDGLTDGLGEEGEEGEEGGRKEER